MDSDFRKILLTAAFLAAACMLIAGAMELMRESQRAEVATLRADLAAWQVGQLMEEARNITRQAAEGAIES